MKALKIITYVGIFSSIVLLISGVFSKNYYLIGGAVLLFLISLSDMKKVNDRSDN
ncbi:hypothetical protein [Vagococcus zengguangii]|uniref:hypothetical protein n=1 Tax=Vagococcus zengguangii TaxID=2571750 RepID=UPI0012B080C2|nr:hypothetical protein [Vagococcus zengguangii]